MTSFVGNQFYSLGAGSSSDSVLFPVLATDDPTSQDSGYALNKRWVNTLTGDEFILISTPVNNGIKTGTWLTLSYGASTLTFLTGNVGGDISPVANGISTLGGNNITSTGSPGIITFSVTGTTDHCVQIGNATGSLTSIVNGTTGQVLTAQTGADPVWTAGGGSAIETLNADSGSASPVANAVTISGGSTGLTTTGSGSTVSLTGTLIVGNGGTGATTLTGLLTGNGTSAVTANAVTNHGVVVGGASNAVGSTAVGASGTVLIGNTGSDPTFSASPSVTSITIVDAPVVGTDGTNKTYVDLIASGFSFTILAYAASTVALTDTYNNGVAGVGATLTNAGAQVAFAIDGVSPPINSVILIKDEATPANNGIYTLTTVGTGASDWVLTRSTSYDVAGTEIKPGTITGVQYGSSNQHSFWVQTQTVTVIGTDPITFLEYAQIVTFPLTLAQGGTGASLTASDGGVLYSTGSTAAILSGTATAGQIVRSGANTSPTWSTATYPATTTVNNILYSSSSNVIGQITAAANGVMISNASNVPSWLANGTAGHILTAQSGAPPAWVAAAGGGITTLNGNSGSATGTTVTITSGTYPNDSGSTTVFTASGSTLTFSVTDVGQNTFIGNQNGHSLSSGLSNTGIGAVSLWKVTTGTANTAVGEGTLSITTGSNNTCIGTGAGGFYTSSESSNICIGQNASGTAGESHVLRIGAGTGTGNGEIDKAYIYGIYNTAVTGNTVFVSTTGQLGTTSSSLKFKLNVVDMEDTTSRISSLRPVNFQYNRESAPGLSDATQDIQYGLIAEEVDKVFPYLCVYDENGVPFGVKYHELPSILLNELQKALKRIEVLEDKIKGM